MKIRRTGGRKTLVMSRVEWEKIGASTKWLKIAQETSINEKQNEVLNLQNTTITVRGIPYLFETGRVYSDHAGDYVIEEIKNDGQILKITYVTGNFKGNTKEYSTLSKAQIIHNETVRNDQRNRIQTMGFSGNKEYFAIGYLAKNGFVSAQVSPSERKWFEKVYNEITHDVAANYLKFAYEIPKEESKWHLELRIGFPEPDLSVASQMSFKYVNITRSSNGLKINNNHFIFNLFKLGFKLGRQNVEDIRNHIPETYMGDFNAGASV